MKSKTENMWDRAKLSIPGGVSLFSKRPELHLPDLWPSHFEKAKGCKITDLDGMSYFDVSLMGVGTNVLGYAYDPVDNAVINNLKKSNMSTLNCPEEVELAEKLVEFDECVEMVKFTRSGGEANTIALRIARAATGRDKVFFCGYHGWHDWYMSANLSGDNLKAHHLDGLQPIGVPKNLYGTSLSFEYNNLSSLKELISQSKPAAIVMEVMRNFQPEPGFLEGVRKIASENDIVLIFDECSSGFRETFGGLYNKYKVVPDIVVYGKTIANGYALNVIGGQRSIMEAAQNTFISSTFWTERTGPTAALKTLSEMERLDSFVKISEIGKMVKNNWFEIGKTAKVGIDIMGIDAIPSFTFREDNLLKKSFMTKKMLEKGYLASTVFYCSLAHTPEILEKYFDSLNDVFNEISVKTNKESFRDLGGKLCQAKFNFLERKDLGDKKQN